MIEVLYENMALPAGCYLGKRVYKKLFYENATLSGADKKILREDVKTILWQYTLKPSTIQILPYGDEIREYLEIAILQVHLQNPSRARPTAEIIHRSIPYPLLIGLTTQNSFAISLAHKRFSQVSKASFVTEEIFITPWIHPPKLTPIEDQFIGSFRMAQLPQTHFFALYTGLVKRVIALNCSAHTGEYSLEKSIPVEEQIQRLKQLERLTKEQREIRHQLKKQKNLGKQVKLNIQHREIRDSIERIKGEL